MSEQRGVSVSTVMQTYRLLEARRVIEARTRSGFYVLAPTRGRVLAPTRSQPSAEPTEITTGDLMTDVLASAADPEMVPLGAALPDPKLLPTARLSRLMSRVLRREPTLATTYMAPTGVGELRREIAKRESTAGSTAEAGDVLVTSGANEALHLSLRAVAEPGDTIAIESPTYFGVLQMIESLGMKALEIPTDSAEGLCLDALERRLEEVSVRACIVTPNFQNPLGSLMPEASKAALVRMLTSRGIAVIEDDVQGEMYYEGNRPRSLRCWDDAQLVLRCGSFTKSLAPGYRVGWLLAGERYRNRLVRLKQSSTIANAAPPQLVLAEFLAGGGYDAHLRRMRAALRTNLTRLAFEVGERFPAGTRVSRPAGGYVLWVRLPEGADALRLYHAARERGISVSPGPIFSASGAYRRFIRLNAGRLWSDRIANGLDALGELIERQIRNGA